ncbi:MULTISPECIES: D-lactate dehydrogenase [unclassified Novosphingobium]|uniref:D-lactate dehydrogenase n=1 Tax=unclassified Novosphingobium TaxID=2644732 RepID=UPI0008691DA5|nr:MULTISPECIES: D-lactate dehydrogenase [unclassified Novosphingobium]MBN9144456.1 D-lactate dehydrogenase [Novosphingobium sp.]MDR6707783.1 D-lactate dehydrogenase [Novosphingobium sp. 1748]ODU84014.1 MAG: D-lactate dehydrogenase [Novosphingobium sp. SCN 63-17]OJX93566.1 MAG: D-lactate dehydrogenase [Novosphingobium sp. 63-713]
MTKPHLPYPAPDWNEQRKEALLARLRAIVGRAHLRVGAKATRRFVQGYRFGKGQALAVVCPGSLIEQWRAVAACVEAGAIILCQASNTGLTGGSTPHGDYDRPVVVISTRRMDRIHVIRDGAQVVCLPGATLYELERRLRPLGRAPHSEIGSSCIGASVIGGVCNNSGGALVRRGPAYTELALYARVDEAGQLVLVNHLGIDLGADPEAMLARLDAGDLPEAAIDPALGSAASDSTYAQKLRDIEAPTPARFNADATRLYEASGSAGKVAVFAVRLDTFPREAQSHVFYIGTNDPAELTALRRAILGDFAHLPVAGEYMHRTCFDLAARYGKDTFLAIRKLGTDRLPRLFAAKAWADGILPGGWSDRALQWLADCLPDHLPPRLIDFRNRFEHHLMLRVTGEGYGEARDWLAAHFPSAVGEAIECTPEEGAAAFLHRFVAAGAAVRYRQVHADSVEDIVALDIALPRNCQDWVEHLPPEIDGKILHRLYYGHFLCHVFHQDYIVAKGVDGMALEHAMLPLLDARGAEYPAEHNVGHLYEAKPALRDHYRALDPCNTFNPGIGGTARGAVPPRHGCCGQ